MRLRRTPFADEGGASGASIFRERANEKDAHFVRLAALDMVWLDGVSPHHARREGLRHSPSRVIPVQQAPNPTEHGTFLAPAATRLRRSGDDAPGETTERQ